MPIPKQHTKEKRDICQQHEKYNQQKNECGHSDEIVCFSDVDYSYDGQHKVLDGISLSISKGDFVCILGSNGSGKSTLAKHINGLLIPDAGQVLTCGFDTKDRETIYDLRSNVGMVFQNPNDQLVLSIVENEIAFGPENLGISPDEIRIRIKESLKRVGMVGFEQRQTNTLSGGQKQRLAIACALACHPKILVLDEASSMLDPLGQRSLLKLVKKLCERGMTVVMVTHSTEEAVLSNKVIALDAGQVVAYGNTCDVLKNTSVLEELNLNAPFSLELSNDLLSFGVDVDVCVDETELKEELCSLFLQR